MKMAAHSPEHKLSGQIIGLFAGKPEVLWPGKPSSAIRKLPIGGSVEINSMGLRPDQQADLKVHGGAEKAIHHYPGDHMPFWQTMFPQDAHRFQPGCFGENISTHGLTEHNLCLGDIFTLGSATVQVCQGRQPCWKLNAHLENNQLAALFQKTFKTGWYYRVLEHGAVQTGDTMHLVDRPNPNWPLYRVIEARFARTLDDQVLRELASVEALSANWQTAFQSKLAKQVENTDARLKGPQGSVRDPH